MAWLHERLHSETLRMQVSMEVLVPQSSGGAPYATLYLLHDMGEDHTAWLRRSKVETYVEGLPLAVVMPSGQRGCYTDMAVLGWVNPARNIFSYRKEVWDGQLHEDDHHAAGIGRVDEVDSVFIILSQRGYACP